MKYQFIVLILFCGCVLLWFTISTSSSYYDLPQSHHLNLSSNVINNNNILVKLKLPSNVPNDTLVNLLNFKYVLNNVSTCSTSEDESNFTAIIMVHSARPNFDQRYAIRNTWGSIKTLTNWRIHLIFLLGSDPESPSKINVDLSNESKEHGDIIMGNFVDSYRNLTYKHLMGYKWVSTFCPTARLILKTDDDIFADIFQIVEDLFAKLISTSKTYACLNMGRQKPIRDAKSKWFVPTTLYADQNYPEYCSGNSYLVKTSDAKKIYDISNNTNFFWIDDVFVTGILRSKYVELSGKNTKSSPLEILNLNERYHVNDMQEIVNRRAYTFILLNKNNAVSEMFRIWNKVKLMGNAIGNAMNNAFLPTPLTYVNRNQNRTSSNVIENPNYL